MTTQHQAIVLSHIRDLDDNYELHANCYLCKHAGPLTRLQPELSIAWVRDHLRCSQCGGTHCAMQIVYTQCR